MLAKLEDVLTVHPYVISELVLDRVAQFPRLGRCPRFPLWMRRWAQLLLIMVTVAFCVDLRNDETATVTVPEFLSTICSFGSETAIEHAIEPSSVGINTGSSSVDVLTDDDESLLDKLLAFFLDEVLTRVIKYTVWAFFLAALICTVFMFAVLGLFVIIIIFERIGACAFSTSARQPSEAPSVPVPVPAVKSLEPAAAVHRRVKDASRHNPKPVQTGVPPVEQARPDLEANPFVIAWQ
ncbi:hypothetical protein J8273_5225 [Carpediemonas membranifera]|uniref:Uncharacterized protein n=1 Tax=Carpediemonas membranifera TaxID=201153 RepID=A0A8J6ATT3_9EUKA|nr:hypothetical protein J8273_5225 [Carpediemonas membranifera]|eukprot:KAG9392240.1 hypothetical protein J8273_5225 [Carpediemonas membranifera]